MGWSDWNDCVKLHEGLQKGEPGIVSKIQNVDEVDFSIFVCSFESMNAKKRKKEARAVHEVLMMSQRLEMASLMSCNLGEVHLKLMVDVFAGVKLTTLNVSRNSTLSSHRGWLLLGMIIKQTGLMELNVECCGLTYQCLKKLIEGMEGAKLTKLSVPYNKRLSSYLWLLENMVSQSGSMELNAEYCGLVSQNLVKLVKEINVAKLTKLDVTGNKTLSPDGWLIIGKIIRQAKSMELVAEYCDLTSQHLEKLAEGMNGAKLTTLNISQNLGISLEGWFTLGRLVKENGLKTLIASNSVDSAAIPNWVEIFVAGMDGAKLDQLEVRSSLIRLYFTPSLLELLPLINENLDIGWWQINNRQVQLLYRKLVEEQLTTLTVELENFRGEVELRADPANFPPCQFTKELQCVNNVTAKQDGDGILVTWDPLSDHGNVSYYIEIKSEGKRVGEPVTCTDTEYRMCSIQPKTKYYFCVWGFTDDTVSKSVSWSKCKTSDILLDAQIQNQGFSDSITETNGRKRPNQDLNAAEGNACKRKKVKPMNTRFTGHKCTIDCKMLVVERMVNQDIDKLKEENEDLRESLEDQQKEIEDFKEEQKQKIDALISTLAKQQREIVALKEEKKTPRRRSQI